MNENNTVVVVGALLVFLSIIAIIAPGIIWG